MYSKNAPFRYDFVGSFLRPAPIKAARAAFAAGELDAAGLNHWTTIDLGTTILVARRIDPFKTYTVDELDSMYDLLTDMKSTAIQDELYAAGAALEHDLNSAALNTYSATKIKKNA